MSPVERHLVDLDALRALSTAGRIELVEALMSLQPATVEELGRFLGRDPTSLYYHLRPLVDVGLVEEAGERPTARRPARLWRLAGNRLEVDPDDRSAEAMEIRKQIVRAVMAKTLRRQEQGLDDPDLVLGGPRPTVMQTLRIVRLKPRGHARVVRKLRELQALLSEEHDPDGRAFALSFQLSPFEAP